MRDDFRIDELRHHDWLYMSVYGELDLTTAPLLEDALERAAQTDAQRIVVDLADLSFIDSSGIRCLLTASQASREDGNRLRLKNPQRAVQRVFELSHAEPQLALGLSQDE